VPSINADGTLAGKATMRLSLGTHYHTSELDGQSAPRPYGLGPRVPLFVVSPWSRGGWVNSQVFDHTSTIRFLEARFGVAEPNISDWHRAVSGDLQSCFDFAHPNDTRLSALPDMSHARGEGLVLEGLPPVAVPSEQRLPVQQRGVRRSRALPYALHAHLRESARPSSVELRFDNVGRAGAVFHVYDRQHLDRLPRRYTVEAGRSLSDTWHAGDDGHFDLSVLGPNGFRREFSGLSAQPPRRIVPSVALRYRPDERELELSGWNTGSVPTVLRVSPNAYRHDPTLTLALPAGGRVVTQRWSTASSGDWYDFSVRCPALPRWSQRFAGRMETGRHGVSDPALGSR
jgi:phospholipase C